MAITLPDFTALPDVTPRAVGGVPSLPAEDPGAAGLATLGKGVSAAGGAAVDIATYRQARQTKMDQTMAEADFTARTIPLSEKLKVETDPEKITALKGQFNEALQTASGAIGNPEARQLWLLQNQKHALQGERDVDLRNMAVYHDRWKGQAGKLVDELARGAATSTDPQAADLANLRIDQLTEEGAKSGSLTATEAQALNSRAKAQLITGRIDTLAARGQADEARTLLEANRADLGPVAAAHLDDAIERRGRIRRDEDEKRQGEDFERGLSGEGPRPAAPGARGRGGPGAISAADHYNYATSIGATPNEAALLTAAAEAESGFNPSATHDAAKLATMGLPPGYGLYGHNGQRLAAMQRAAGTEAPSWQDQIKFGLQELRRRPEGAQVNAAKTAEQLTDLQLRFEQPGPTGVNRARRLAATQRYMSNPPSPTGGGAAVGAATGGGGDEAAAPTEPGAGAAPAEAAKPDWAALAQRIRDSDLPPGAKTEAFRRLEARKQMAEFGTQEPKQQYNARVHAAVEQRIDDIVQGAARSDDPAVRAKAEQDLSTIIKWSVDTGAVPANKGYEAERAAKTQLVTGRAQYLDASGQSDAALALIQQNKDTLPPAIYQEQVRNLTPRAETQQGTRFERELQIGGGPGYVPGEPTPGMLPGASAESPISTAPSPLQQKLQAIADSDLPDAAKKAAHAAALQRHELEVVGQDRAKSDLDLAIGKGQAGRIDIEQAYRDGRIAPSARTEMHRTLDKIEADQNAAAVAMAKVNNAANGGAPLDPKSDYDKKALNYHFDKVSAGWPADEVTARSLDYAAKYGLLPERFKGLIRGSLHSGDPASMVAAADTVNRIRNRNPQLVGEIGDENDLRLATLLQTYTDAGIKPEAAVQLAAAGMKVGKPEQEARSEAFDLERGKSKADQHDADSKWLSNQLNSIWRPDPDVDPVMRKEFEEVSRAEYQRTGNLEASRRMALDNMNGVWGRTRVGGDLRYMKNSPEQKYGVPGLSDRENAAWMNEQMLSDTTRGALQDPTNPITADRLHLVRAPDWIDRDGRPAYQVFLEHPTTKTWELIRRPDGEARVWAPDWATSAEKQRRDVALQDRIGMLRQERRIGGFVGTGAP